MTDLVGSEATTSTPGAALASARERLGLSVADVAGQMRIAPRQVEAIEADRYGELPGAVFVRGFVRNYARLLKLDPQPLLHALEPELASDAPLRAHVIAGALPGPARRGRTVGWLSALVVLLACVLGAGLYEYLRSRPGEAVSTTSIPPPDATVGSPVSEPKPTQDASPPPVPTPVEPIDPAGGRAVQESSQATATEALPVPHAIPSAASVAPGTRRARIGVEFVRESWIEIRDRAGNVVHSGTGAADSKRVVEVEPPVSVVVGNVSGMRITYNESPFDMAPHATRNIARFTLE